MVLDFAPPWFSCSGTLPAPVDLINESNLPFSLYDNPRKPTGPWANSRQYTPLDYWRTGGLRCEQDQLFDVNNYVCRRIYDEAVRQAVIVAWEASDRICGKGLKEALPNLVWSMERHGHPDMNVEVRERLLSAGT